MYFNWVFAIKNLNQSAKNKRKQKHLKYNAVDPIGVIVFNDSHLWLMKVPKGLEKVLQ